ncbi:DinB family protein [Actinopolymorpha pittospori]
MSQDVPFAVGEKESLHSSLNRHRDVVVWKLEGLDDEQVRRPMVPSGTSLLGLVKHLASIEFGWFCETFGRPSEWIAWDPDDCDGDARVEPHETTADILAFYARARAAADSVIDELDLDQVATPPPGLGSGEVTLRWLLIHVLEDTARHAGHMDILRELIDGRIGDHPRDENVPT